MEHNLDGLDDLPAALAADLDRAFERLVLTYQHRLYGFALRLAGSPRDAEEIAQDAMLRAYRALSTYPAERIRALHPRAWLYQITLNVFRNRARAAAPREVSLEGEDGGSALDVAADHHERPEVAAEAAERQGELAARLSALPRHFRVAVVLRHVEGLSYREIADMLDQPTGTVKAHVHRGTLLLREALLREPGERGEIGAGETDVRTSRTMRAGTRKRTSSCGTPAIANCTSSRQERSLR